MFTRLVNEEKACKNPAAVLKLPPRHEAGACSLATSSSRSKASL